MLKKSLPYAVQKLLASRSDKDEIFFDFTAFTNRVILTAEARLNPPKKKNDKTSEKNSDRNNSQKSGSPKKKNHQQNHQQSTNGNGKNLEGAPKKAKVRSAPSRIMTTIAISSMQTAQPRRVNRSRTTRNMKRKISIIILTICSALMR